RRPGTPGVGGPAADAAGTVREISGAGADRHPAEPPGALTAWCRGVALAVAIESPCGAAGVLWHWGLGSGRRRAARVRPELGAAARAERLLPGLVEARAEPAALLTEGPRMFDEAARLLDELDCRGGWFGLGAGGVSHFVASCHRAALPSLLIYEVPRDAR